MDRASCSALCSWARLRFSKIIWCPSLRRLWIKEICWILNKKFHLKKKLTFHAYLFAVASSLFVSAGYLAGCRAEEAKHVAIAAFEWFPKG